jgi:hypothetical protein
VLAGDCLAAGAALAWALLRRRRALLQVLDMGWGRWLLAAALLLPWAGAILFEPLQAWDARSIWFFGAKRIYFGGGLAGAGDWTLAAYAFSHADYPKLLPLLGAQFASAWGVWNEYIPKASLLVLLAPVIVGLLGLPRRIGLSLVFLLGVLLLSTKEYLWNGYADTYLCLYAVLSMLYFARWLEASEPLDLASRGVDRFVAAVDRLCRLGCHEAPVAADQRPAAGRGFRAPRVAAGDRGAGRADRQGAAAEDRRGQVGRPVPDRLAAGVGSQDAGCGDRMVSGRGGCAVLGRHVPGVPGDAERRGVASGNQRRADDAAGGIRIPGQYISGAGSDGVARPRALRQR